MLTGDDDKIKLFDIVQHRKSGLDLVNYLCHLLVCGEYDRFSRGINQADLRLQGVGQVVTT